MTMSRSSAPRWSIRLLAVLIVLLSCSSGGCAKRVTYVAGTHRLTHLKAGDSAPHAGVLMSEEYLSEIYEALGRK
jgi:hypothetical protein